MHTPVWDMGWGGRGLLRGVCGMWGACVGCCVWSLLCVCGVLRVGVGECWEGCVFIVCLTCGVLCGMWSVCGMSTPSAGRLPFSQQPGIPTALYARSPAARGPAGRSPHPGTRPEQGCRGVGSGDGAEGPRRGCRSSCPRIGLLAAGLRRSAASPSPQTQRLPISFCVGKGPVMGNLRTGMWVTGPTRSPWASGAGSLALLGGRAESLWKEPLRKTPGEGRGRGRCSRRQRGAGAGRVGVSVGRADCVAMSVGGAGYVAVLGGQAV